MNEPSLVATLNDLFIKKTDGDMQKVRELVDTYIKDRSKKIPDVTDVKTQIDKEAHIITLSISGKKSGKVVNGTRKWAEAELLTSNSPVTQIFESLFDDVFEVPSEGTPVS